MSLNEKKKNKSTHSIWRVLINLIRLAAKYQKSILVCGVLLVVLTAAQRIFELLVSPMILSAVETKAPLPQLLLTILFFTVGILLTSSLRQYIEVYWEHPKYQLTNIMLKHAGEKYTRTSYSNTLTSDFEEHARIAFNSVGYTEAPSDCWGEIVNLIWNFIGFLVFGLVLGRFHYLLTALILVLSVGGALLKLKLDHQDEDSMKQIRRHFGQAWFLVDTMYDQAKGIGKDIRIFHMQEWICDLYQGVLNAMHAWYVRRERNWFFLDLIDVCVTFLRNGIGYFFCLSAFLSHTITLPEFLLYTAAIGGFTSWINGIVKGFVTIKRQTVNISQYFDFLETPEPFRMEGGAALPSGENGYEITLDHVSYRYPGAEEDAVSDVNLTIRPFEKVAIVGVNGAGKTTLISLILGLLDPSEGSVKLNGVDVRTLNRPDYYTLFSAVFQSFQALQAPLHVNICPSNESYDKDKMDRALELAELKDKIDSLPEKLNTYYYADKWDFEDQFFDDAHMHTTTFSGGELQRLMLARALYKDAPILILDEPTAALDPIAEDHIYQQYHAFTADKSAVFISHRLASTRFCDRVLLMDHGKIIEEGTHESLMEKRGAYAELFEVQSRYYTENKEDEDDDF